MPGRPARLRPAAVPVRPARPARAGGRRVRRRRRRPVDRHADRPAAAGRRRRPVHVRPRARLPAEHRHAPACARRPPGGSTAASTSTCRRRAIGATIGSKEFVGTLPQWLRLRAPDRDTVLYPAASYPTYEMGAILAVVPAGRRADDRRPAASTWRRSTPPTPPGRCAVGEQPGEPDRRARRPRRRRRVGPGPRRARVLRRVLRRVHVGRPRPQHPRARPRRRRRRALAVQALQPRRRPGRLLRR